MPANRMRTQHPGLTAVRVLWIALALMILLYLVAGLPHLLIYYGLPCEADPSPICTIVEIGLRSLGLNWSFYAWYSVLWIATVCILSFVLCSLMAWQKKDDSKTLLFSIALLLGLVMNVDYSLPNVITESYPAAIVGTFTLVYLGQISTMLFYVFPDGHFVPDWTRWAVVLFAVLNLATSFLGWYPQPSMGWAGDLLNFSVWLAFPLTFSYALFYRYRKAANLEQRQQIKWIVWTVVLSSTFVTADNIIEIVGKWLGWDISVPIWYAIYQALVSPTIFYAFYLLVTLCFYVAILRYRLWDIDFFINRSLVYGGLTVVLGSVLVGVFAATQALLDFMVKDIQAGAAGIISVIVVIALFSPVRDRLQRFIDKRFYGVDPGHERAVQAAIAEERDRLSQELHDSVTQSLYGLTIMAESGQRLARDEEARKPLVEMGDVARQALKEMRLLIYELRPPALEEEGLLSVLHQRLAAVERRSGIETSLRIDEVVDLPARVEEALYHIAIEALNNAIKHAAATSVSLSLHTSDTWVEMEITDDGEGFDPSSDSSRGGMGLTGMRKRAEELGGTLLIHSAPGQGTTVSARLSYQPDSRKRRAKSKSNRCFSSPRP